MNAKQPSWWSTVENLELLADSQISDLANYWQDPGFVTTIVAWVLGIVGGASAWLYRRLRGPKLEVSLEPVL